jgi:dTDP-4-dehydrorhamnose 3,5-epimerase
VPQNRQAKGFIVGNVQTPVTLVNRRMADLRDSMGVPSLAPLTWSNVRFERTPLGGAWIIELEPNRDERGSFARSFCEHEFAAHGLPIRFPQSNISHNTHAGTMRGMHFNAPDHEESKVVRCTRGAVYDVIVDLRRESSTYRHWFGIELDAESGRALFVPEGFAHGFLTLVDDTDVSYLMGAFYEPDAALGVRWDDPAFDIDWPREPAVISRRDATYPDFEPKLIEG